MMSGNTNMMIFILFLYMMGVFSYTLHTENSYFKGKFFNKFLIIMGIIISIMGVVLMFYIECQTS